MSQTEDSTSPQWLGEVIAAAAPNSYPSISPFSGKKVRSTIPLRYRYGWHLAFATQDRHKYCSSCGIEDFHSEQLYTGLRYENLFFLIIPCWTLG